VSRSPPHAHTNARILGCGWISSKFALDLALPRPEVRDVAHAVIAAATQDSKARADEFIAKFLPQGASAQIAGLAPLPVGYGSYAEVINHPVSEVLGTCSLEAAAQDCSA